MSTPSEQTLALLTRIAVAVEKLAGANGKPATGPAVADNVDLDSKFGDEQIRFNPRDWAGESVKGKRMSECEPAALDALAASLDYFAQKNEGVTTDKGKPKSDFDRRSAGRARGWAARLRAGWKPAAPQRVAGHGDAYEDNEAEAEAQASANDPTGAW